MADKHAAQLNKVHCVQSHIVEVEDFSNNDNIFLNEASSILDEYNYIRVFTGAKYRAQNIISNTFCHSHKVIILTRLRSKSLITDLIFHYRNTNLPYLFLLDSNEKLTEQIISHIYLRQVKLIHFTKKAVRQINPNELVYNHEIIAEINLEKDLKKLFQDISVIHKILLCILYCNHTKSLSFLEVKLNHIVKYMYPKTINVNKINGTQYLYDLVQLGLISNLFEINLILLPDIKRYIDIKLGEYYYLRDFMRDREYHWNTVNVQPIYHLTTPYSVLKEKFTASKKPSIPADWINASPSIHMQHLMLKPCRPPDQQILLVIYSLKGVFRYKSRHLKKYVEEKMSLNNVINMKLVKFVLIHSRIFEIKLIFNRPYVEYLNTYSLSSEWTYLSDLNKIMQ